MHDIIGYIRSLYGRGSGRLILSAYTVGNAFGGLDAPELVALIDEAAAEGWEIEFADETDGEEEIEI